MRSLFYMVCFPIVGENLFTSTEAGQTGSGRLYNREEQRLTLHQSQEVRIAAEAAMGPVFPGRCFPGPSGFSSSYFGTAVPQVGSLDRTGLSKMLI